MLFRVLIGLVVMAIGFHMVWKTDLYLDFIGRVDFAERKLGFEGGTRLFLKLVGVGACFLGAAIATNLIQDMLTSTLLPLFTGLQ